nr:helix-turn-helix domain-containing protein [Paenibacillus wynnii]
MQRQTITVKEAAELLGVSQTTVYAMVRQGQIPAVRVRSRIFFTRLALEEWLRSGGVTA